MSTVLDTAEHPEFVAGLLARGLLLQTGVPGLYGHGAEFERARTGLESRLTREALAYGAQPLRFPPVVPRGLLTASGYQSSFPHLMGTVHAFDPDLVPHGQDTEHEPWDEYQRMTDLVLCPAACYPVYPAVAARGPLAADGLTIETGGAWVFRREPSRDPGRRQSFHMHELVRLGDQPAVHAFYDRWQERGLDFLRRLGLEVTMAPATDPFFGREGRLLAAHQRAQSLKFEFLVPVAAERPSAIGSINLHGDHFGESFGIELAAGGAAHSACLAFGHERIVLALLRRHGLEVSDWPATVRDELELGR